MKQNNLSIDFKLAVVESNNYVFNFNVQHSIQTSTEIMIQNFDGKKSVPAYYIPESQKLIPIGIDGYWTVSHYTLTFTAVPPGGDIAALEARVDAIELELRDVSSDVDELVDDVADIKETLPTLAGRVDNIVSYLSSAFMYRAASGNPAIFTDGSAGNFENVSVTIMPTQSGSGDPYPPGGGKNLLSFPTNSSTQYGVTFTANKDSAGNVRSVTLNGTASNTDKAYFRIGAPLDVPPGTYTLSGWPSDANVGGRIYNDGGTVSGGFSIYYGRSSHTVTLSATTRLAIWFETGLGSVYNNFTISPMLCAGTDTNFAPYSNIRPISGVSSVTVTRTGENGADPQTVTVQLTDGSNPLTVYGGALDVTSGTLTVDSALYEFDASNSYELIHNKHFVCRDVYIQHTNSYDFYSTPGTTTCNMFVYAYNSLIIPSYYFTSYTATTSSAIFSFNSQAETVEDWVAWLANGNKKIQLWVPLETPLTYQLTPAQMSTIAGYNNVSTDAGSVRVMYLSDGSLHFN